MGENFHANQGEDYYDFMSKDDDVKNDNVIYMWKDDGKKYKKVYDVSLKEFVWELAE